MDYVIAIMSAVIIFPIIAFLITVPFILYNYHKYGTVYYFRSLIIYSFVLYLMVIYFLVILPLPNVNEINMEAERCQLIPFKFIFDFITESAFILNNPSTYLTALTSSYFYVPIFNVLMFIPFVMYLRYYFKCSLKKTVLISFLLSLFFEITQLTGLYFLYPHSYRLFDVDDLILNTVGGTIGFYLVNLFKKLLPSSKEIEENTNKRRVKVSISKRITLFLLDLLIFIIIYSVISFMFSLNIVIVAFIYYVVIPYFTKGRTLASKFLHITLISKKETLKFYQIIIRNGLFVIFLLIVPYFNLFCILITFFNFIYFIIKKEFIYETISKTKLASTFAVRKTDKN